MENTPNINILQFELRFEQIWTILKNVQFYKHN
jgi:hypothetical protein